MSYTEKLKDPRWQKKRLEVMNRDNFTCQKCGATDKPLVVHHKTYERCFGRPWGCPDSDLITLCEDCHENVHKRAPRILYYVKVPGANAYNGMIRKESVKLEDIDAIMLNADNFFKDYEDAEILDVSLFLTRIGLDCHNYSLHNIIRIWLYENGWIQKGVEDDNGRIDLTNEYWTK